MQKKKHCVCLALNSLWFLHPTIIAIWQNNYTHAMLSFCACVFSILHWTNYSQYSKWFWIDIGVANTTVVYYIYHTPLDIRPFQLACITSAGVFFAHACRYPVGCYRGLASHVWFRYLTYNAMMRNFQPWSMIAWYFSTLIYIVSIACAYQEVFSFQLLLECFGLVMLGCVVNWRLS